MEPRELRNGSRALSVFAIAEGLGSGFFACPRALGVERLAINSPLPLPVILN